MKNTNIYILAVMCLAWHSVNATNNLLERCIIKRESLGGPAHSGIHYHNIFKHSKDQRNNTVNHNDMVMK